MFLILYDYLVLLYNLNPDTLKLTLKTVAIFIFICTLGRVGASLPVDSLRSAIIEESHKRMQVDSLEFPYARQLAEQLSTDSIHSILKGMPLSKEKVFAMSYFLSYKIDPVNNTPIPWLNESLAHALELNDPKLLFTVYHCRGRYYKALGKMEEALNSFELSNSYASDRTSKVQSTIKENEMNNGVIYIFFGGLLVIALLSFLFFRSIRNKNKILKLRNAKIDDLNKKLSFNVSETTKELKDKSESLENYISNLPGVAYRLKCDEEYTPVYISDNCKEFYGVDQKTVLNDSRIYLSLIHPDYVKEVTALSKAYVRKNKTEEHLEQIYPDPCQWKNQVGHGSIQIADSPGWRQISGRNLTGHHRSGQC